MQARSKAPDYNWPSDPCPDVVKRACQDKCTPEALKAAADNCYRSREPRGLAGLPGGHWLGLTYRASTIRATSMGQDGGDGGPGIDHLEYTKCNAPPVKRTCGFIFPTCNDINDPADNLSCDVPTDSPPSDHDFCACGACEASKCSVNFAEDQPAGGGCVVACEVPSLARGYVGGQAGPGGAWGLIRISEVVRESGCEADFSEDNLRDPSKVHLADERCLNDAADDGDPAAVDCSSELCSLNPNVTVCPIGDAPVQAGTGKRPKSLDGLLQEISKLYPGDLAAFNPIRRFDPRINPGETRTSLIDVDRRNLVQIDYPQNSLLPIFGGVAARPIWAPAESVLLPDALWKTSVTFRDEGGSLTFPSPEAELLLSHLLDSPVFSRALAPGGATAADVLGFESISGWSSNVALQLSSDQRSQGQGALSLPGGWVQLTSSTLSSLGGASSSLSFDVRLPAPAVNPWWAGDVSVLLDAPSVGVYSTWIGQRSLQGLGLGTFQHIALNIPPDVASRLAGHYSDLRVKLTLNTASGGGRYLLDNLAFDGVAGGGAGTPFTPEALTFGVSLPHGVTLDQAALGASGELRIDDGAQVLTDAGGFAPIANTGAGQTNVGVSAHVGRVVSVAPVTLRDRAQVTGDVLSGSGITSGASVSVSGARLESRDLSPLEQLSFVLQAGPSHGSVSLEPDMHASLAPGSYGALSVKSRAVLQLSAGTYFFDSFGVEPQAHLVLDALDGPVVLVVRSQLFFRGSLEGAAPESVLFAFAGTQPVAIEASLGATLVAPNAAVRYATGSTAHAGSVFAKSIELDPRVTFERRPFAYWSLFGGASEGQSRLGQMVAFVRSSIAAANPGLLAQEALNPRAVLELGRLSASTEFRNIVTSTVVEAAAALPPDLARKFLTPHIDWYTKEGKPPQIRIGSGDLQNALLEDGIDRSGGTAKRLLCGDTLSGAVFGKALEGSPGQPGSGGVAADARRCLGFKSSFDKACFRQAPAQGKSCTRGLYGSCPNPKCETRMYFPQPGEACPVGYSLQPIPSLSIGGVSVVFPTCPDQIDTTAPGIPPKLPSGNIDCHVADGSEGTRVLPTPPNSNNPAPDQIHAWTYDAWAVALSRLSGVELSRRVGRGNTLYKRGEAIAAAARYLSARSLLLANFHQFGNPQCSIFPQTCPVCPDDPSTLSNPAAGELCGSIGDVNQKLRQLTASTNFYGYTQGYVPPASMRLFDATSSVDLVSLVKDELSRASTQTEKWIDYGNIVNEQFHNAGRANALLDLEREALGEAVAAGGSLSLGVDGSNQRIRDLAKQLFLIHEKIKALNVVKANLHNGNTFAKIDLGELVGIVVVAAATAYGGPAGGAAAALVWSGIEKGLSADDASNTAIQDRKSTPGATLVSSKGCVQVVQDSQKLPDGNACWDKFKGKLIDGLAESDTVKGLIAEFMQAAGLTKPAGPDALKSLIVDNTIASLTIEAYRAAGDLGTALQEGILSDEKYREAVRQIARINRAKTTLGQVPATGFPAPEVQLALADLAFKSAAAAVDRAGEYYFLLRRGAERDLVPLDPVTGKSNLTERERVSLTRDIECAGVTTPSLDINFSSLACFDLRADFLNRTAAGARNGRSLDQLEVADTVVPFADWKPVKDADGADAYQFTLSIDFDKSQRGSRGSGAGQPRQRFHDATFFLETDDARPAPVRMLIRRPAESADVYYIGKANNIPQFQVFDVARGAETAPPTPLFELLRDQTQYARFAFACNGLNEQSPLGGELDVCKLSNLDEDSRAFLINRSLIGELEFSIKKSDLAGKQPRRFFAYVRYSYDTFH